MSTGEPFDQRLSDVATLAVIQTTLIDHERRLTKAEENQERLMFWTMGAALTSSGTFVGLIVTVVLFFVTKH